MIKRIAALGVLTTAIVGAALVPAGPASAHNLTLILEAGGIRTTGKLTQTHTWVTNCDNMADGHGTRTRYILSNGREEYVGDPDGQGGSCGAERAPMTVISMQVCFKAIGPNEQCNPWRAA